MARKFAQVKVSIWDSGSFRSLNATAQRLYFVLLTRVETSLAGVIEWHPGRFAQLASDTSPDDIEQAAAELEEARFIVIDRTTQECLLRTLIRHDETLRKGTRVAAGVVAAWRAIYSRHLRSVVADEVAKIETTSTVHQVIEPLISWRIECPTEYVNETSNDMPTDTLSEEVSGQQATGNIQQATSRADALFTGFWSVYPRRVAKKAAEKAWAKAVRAVDPNLIIAGAARYADQTRTSDPRFVKHPATWLNGGCWDDEPASDSADPDGWMNA